MMFTRWIIVSLIAVFVLMIKMPGARAQDGEAQLIGMIPGTDLLRDEFRARANVQLKAIALNAMTYRLLHQDEYPPDLYTLKNSECWNLDILNMFTGRPIQAIYFEPGKNDFTTREVYDIPMAIDAPMPSLMGPDGEINAEALSQAFDSVANQTQARVDASQIRGFTGGDVYYYVNGDLLQLVMFAPDGSFLEHVDEMPNSNWRRLLETPMNSLWPDSVVACQVLHFAERLVPQYYNLVEFMGNRETMHINEVNKSDAQSRIDMALEMGISILNPITREPIMMTPSFNLGDLAPSIGGEGDVIRIFLRDGQAWSVAELNDSKSQIKDIVESSDWKPNRKPGKRPPLGGR